MIKNNFPFKLFKKKEFNLVYLIFLFCFLLFSCHKSPGAICRDGSQSNSTGRGTCSWHGGVDHYIDTDEISIPKTAGIIIIVGFIGFVVIGNCKDNPIK